MNHWLLTVLPGCKRERLHCKNTVASIPLLLMDEINCMCQHMLKSQHGCYWSQDEMEL